MGHAVALYASSSNFSAAFWASYGAWFLMEIWIAGRDRRAATGENRDAFTKLAFYIFLPAGIVGAFFAAWRLPVAAIGLPPEPMFWTGVGLTWAGMAFRAWAVITLGRFFRTTVFLHDDHRLVTAGPYRVLRHPSYTGSLISVLGIGLCMGNWASVAAIVAGLLLSLLFRIRAEDAALGDRFGEAFADYRKRRSALIPGVW